MGRVVKYSVSLDEKWEDVAPFFKAYPTAMAQLCVKAGRDDAFVFETMSVKGLLEAVRGDIPTEIETSLKGCTVGQYAARVNSLREGMAGFVRFMEDTIPPVTVEQRKMAMGTKKGNIEEAVLMTLKTCFSLHSLEQAHNLTIYEYMTARKEVYNEAVVAYNRASAFAAARR